MKECGFIKIICNFAKYNEENGHHEIASTKIASTDNE